jgi:hypothetical protein
MRSRLAIWIGVVALFAAALLGTASQGSSQAAGTGLILGQAVDAETGRGVAGVLVTLTPPVPPPAPIGELLEYRPPSPPSAALAGGPAAGSRRTLTADDGRFLFRELPKGRFDVFASAPGYVPGVYGQLRPQGPNQSLELEDGQKLGGVTMKIWKFGSISGTIRDELGEPAVGVGVECLRKVISGGQRRFTTTSTTMTTDDRGIYRIASLPPGEYICVTQSLANTTPVSVMAATAAANETGNPNSSEAYRRMQNSGASAFDTRGLRVGDLVLSFTGVSLGRGLMPPPPDAKGRLTAYAPVYYPATPVSSQASVIALRSGEDKTAIDLRLRLVPAVRVSGTLTAPNGPGGFLSVRLVPASGNDMVSEGQAEVARTVSDATGAFTFLGIPSGQYVLKARLYPRPAPGPGGGAAGAVAALDETALWTSTPVDVGDADVRGLSIALRPGLRATGRVEFAGSRPAPSAAELQRIGIRLHSADGRTSSPIPVDGRVAADGTFRTSGYPAGRYIVALLASTIPPGWFVKSIMAAGRDVSVDPLELGNADASGLVIAFTDKTTELSGSVSGPNGPDETAEVVVFPADSTGWKEVGAVARRTRIGRAAKGGAFSFTGLPAGEYFVAIIAGSDPRDRQDPAVLAALLPAASRVSLADGGSATVQLTVKSR